MKFNVTFRRAAGENAKAAARYIAEHADPEVAQDWYRGLLAAIASLIEMPERCPLARENGMFPDLELRQLTYQSHRLIFAVIGNVVHVFNVRHQAQSDLQTPAESPEFDEDDLDRPGEDYIEP